MKQAEVLLYEGVHPRMITEGYEIAKNKSLEILEDFKSKCAPVETAQLFKVAQTSLSTKISAEWAQMLTPIVTEAVQIIKQENEAIDLHMVEIMHMVH